MLWEWLGASWAAVGLVLLSSVLTVLAVLVGTRLVGLRSFSKMSSFDFAITVAIGTVLASTSLARSIPLAHAVAALVGLFGTQQLIALLRGRTRIGGLVDNQPVLVMIGDRMLAENMRATQITASDIRAKLREANVLRYEQVRAVVFETTGDVSVLHGEAELDPDLLQGVKDAELLRDS